MGGGLVGGGTGTVNLTPDSGLDFLALKNKTRNGDRDIDCLVWSRIGADCPLQTQAVHDILLYATKCP